ncbi:MAG: GNAT family N-acetyltransferase [Pseudomonadota bacterium]|nr:GNAT family N-acetyltransferase [Pseudomonadota bacterium]
MPTIRDACTAADIEHVRELFVEYQSALGVDLCFQGFSDELAALPGRYARPSGRLLLAEDGSSALGVVALRSVNDADCEMKRLYVRPSARGLGLGRLLTTSLIDEARLAGYQRMLLDTLPSMAKAQKMYRSMRFTEIPPYYNNPVDGTLYMALSLRND